MFCLKIKQLMLFMLAKLHLLLYYCAHARVVKSVDTGDLKSPDLQVVPVRVWPRAPSFYYRNDGTNKEPSFKLVFLCLKFNKNISSKNN